MGKLKTFIAKLITIIKAYERWEWAQLAISLWLFEVAFAFLWGSMSHPVMTEDTYGGVIYYIPAEAWSIWIMFASVLQFSGVWWNIRYMAIIGSLMHFQVFSSFAYFAMTAVIGDLVVFFAGIMFTQMYVLFLAVNVMHEQER